MVDQKEQKYVHLKIKTPNYFSRSNYKGTIPNAIAQNCD
jgi:hypothetical protein